MALDLDQIRALADRVARSHGLDVVDIEYQGGGGKYRTLRVFIEKNAEGRARLLALAAQQQAVDAADTGVLEEDDDADVLEEEGQEPEFEDDFEDDVDEQPGAGVDEDGDEEAEYDHDAFLASLPSVANLEHLSGVTHGDCEQFSRDFGTVLDVEELVPGTEYLLEVSSPGLDRRLQKEVDYLRFRGSLVKIQTFEPVAGNRHWQGRLAEVKDGVLTVTPAENKKDGRQKKGQKKPSAPGPQPIEIPLNNVEKANLVPEF